MGSKIKKQEAVAEELKERGNICVLCKAKSDEVEIHWHHVIMLFEKPPYLRGCLEIGGKGLRWG